ncbi:MAG: PqqD family peptide modification chaperone [Phycisphaerae bacterium]|nr:PqqD family peptide modification chaperone [Phycisphaerae bacterium]
MNERPTFSPFWHRVRLMKPRLRSHVQITRQRYRGRRWHVAHDPTSNQFYRLNPVAHDFVGMLDGTRDVETCWKISLQKFGDSAPTQNEVIQLMSQLYNSNLLSVDSSPETEQLLTRGRERVKRRIQQQAIGIMYFKIRLFNPDRVLTWLEPIFRPLLNVWGLAAWAVFLLFCMSRVLPHWGELASGLDSVIAPGNWGWLILVFVVTKAIHETGHGLICKRFGGQVPEFGAMLLVLFPSPYVDASSCWAFPSKWQRMAVGAGGMIFELFVACVAALVWINTAPGDLARQIAYNAMITASISTVLFNANPLMRFDGYYILADLLETPNLMQRSAQMLKYLLQRHVFRLERLQPPSSQRSEQAILVVYGVLSMAYRVFLFLSITLYVLGQFFIIGVILAVWTAAAWFLVPIGGLAHWLATSPALGEHRGRTIASTLGMIALAGALVGLVPLPDYRRGNGVIENPTRQGVFVGADGFIVEAPKRPGDRVAAGEIIARLESEELVARRRELRAVMDELRVNESQSRQEGEPAAAQIVANRIGAVADQLAEVDRRLEQLNVRSPIDGVVVGPDPSLRIGSYARRGERMCEVVNPADVRVAAVMSQSESAWLFELGPESHGVEMRLRSDAWTPVTGTKVWALPAGQTRLPHEGLGFHGGGDVEVDQRDPEGRRAKQARFVVYIEADFAALRVQNPEAVAPGERVRLRFSLPSKPILTQVIDRVQKVLQGKVNL